MPDDRTSKRMKPRVMSDHDRHAQPRAQTQPGVPAHVDAEITPPPQMVPTIGMDVRDQIRVLAEQTEHALEKLWDERGNAGRIEKLEAAVSGYVAQVARQQQTLDDFLVPGLKDLMAASEESGRAQVRLETILDSNNRLLADISSTLRGLDARMGRLEVQVERLATGHETLTEDLDRLDKRITGEVERLEARVDKLERRHEKGETESAQRARWFSWSKAALVGAVAAVSAIATNLDDIVRWLT